MSTSKRRGSNSNNCQMANVDLLNATKDLCDAAACSGINKFNASSGDDGVGELIDMTRVCRCCSKGDTELLSLFEENDETGKQTTQYQRRHKTTPTITKEAATETATQQKQQTRNRANPVEYALSGARSSMDTVREEMLVWMLNISPNDGLPQEICRQCTAQFVMVAKFRRRCLRVQQRLQQVYAQSLVERTQNEEMTRSEDYLHLAGSPAERKRHLLEPGQEQQPAQPKEDETEAVESAATPKRRRVQMRARGVSLGSWTGAERMSLRSPGKRMDMPWRTKAARKQLIETSWSDCCRSSGDGSSLRSSSRSSPEQLSDLSVNSCHGFDCDGQSSSSTSSSTSTPPNKDGSAKDKANTKLIFPPKHKKPIVVRRRGLRPRAAVSCGPRKDARRTVRTKQTSADRVLSNASLKEEKSEESPAPGVLEKAAGGESVELRSSTESPAAVETEPKPLRAESVQEASSPASTEVDPESQSPKSSEGVQETQSPATPQGVRSAKSPVRGQETQSSLEGSTRISESSESLPELQTPATSPMVEESNATAPADSVPELQSPASSELVEELKAPASSELRQDLQSPASSERLTEGTEAPASTEKDQRSPEPAESLAELSTPEAPELVLQWLESPKKEISEIAEMKSPTPSERVESSPTQGDMKPKEQVENISGDVNEASDEQSAVGANGSAESADSTVQFEELTSSTTEHIKPALTPEVPAAETEIEVEGEQLEQIEDENLDDDSKSELIVSIPLKVLDGSLQRKLCTSAESLAELELELDGNTKETDTIEPDDVNNNENGEHFCQSATADSFNAAVALRTKQIEAEPNGGPPAEEAPPDDDDDMESLERLTMQQQQEQQPPTEEVQPPRPAMDFLAEFEKHCEKTMKMQAQVQQKPPRDNVQQELVEAKQQLEVEMNDVETTLHGILNEMQDQHLYNPVCSPMDEFLTPADYVTTDKPVPEAAQEQHEDEQPKEVNPFDSSNFSNELIGFQNDMPCFETIETVHESSLQLELTKLLNDLQPAAQQQQQQQQPQQPMQLQVESANYETLYSVPVPPAAAAATGNSNKLQVIQMAPQETLWQAQTTAAPQPTAATQLQWSTVGGLEAIKATPVAELDNLDEGGTTTTTTTTYYINTSDLYQTQMPQQTAQLTGDGYALLDSNENYVLEQQQHQQHQQLQQPSQHPLQQPHQQQPQQPIMILIQQPELQQPVASASNPQQAPLHISYGSSRANELHAYPQQQLQQLQPLQQHQQLPQHAPQKPQQKVQNNTVLGLPAAVPPPVRGRPPMLKCRFCQNGPRFSSSLEYSRHIIDLHPAVAPFNCPHCPLAFAGRNKRSQHILSQHMVQQFHCGQCSQMLPSQRALDLHLQRFHMPLPTEPAQAPPTEATAAIGGAVRLEEVQLQLANSRDQSAQQQLRHPPRQQQQQHHMPALEVQTSSQQPRRTRILCCPDCEDCSTANGHLHGSRHSSYEELSNLQPPPTVLTPPSTIASLPSPQPAPHITLPSPEQSEPDSTTATLRQFRKRCTTAASATATATTTTTTSTAGMATTAATATMLNTAASSSPSSSPSSSTMETSGSLQLRSNHQCVVCEKRFTNVIALRKHQQLAHDSQTTMPWVCGICKRGYRKRTDMDNHMKSHEPKGRPYECNECWVRFPEFKQLAMHKFTVHELIKPHTCDECGKQFGTESALKTHIKFHGELGFDCEECGNLYASIKELRKHRRSHNRELFYKCDKCPRTFQHFTSYRAHINTHLPLGVFLNDKMPSSLSSKMIETPSTPTPAMIEDPSLPLTPLSNCNGNGGNIEDCPGSVELVESSMAQSLDLIVETP